VKLVHLVGFIIKKFVTMHCHLNVKILHSNLRLYQPIHLYAFHIKIMYTFIICPKFSSNSFNNFYMKL